MSWKQISFEVKKEHIETLEDRLLELGALSVTLLDAEDKPIFEPAPGESPTWENSILSALFEEDIDHNLVTNEIAKIGISKLNNIETVEDQDWERAWMDNFHPMKFGDKLWICPKNQLPPEPNEVNIMLDPGLAFGTGTHPTTALCLEWLDSIDLEGKTVIDFGCGSGVLGIAAVLLGAERCIAIDNDPQALTATADNADENNCREKIEIYLPEKAPDIKADVLVANILAQPLIELSSSFANFCNDNSLFAISGILHEQERLLHNKYSNYFSNLITKRKDDWILIHGNKTSPKSVKK